MLRRSGGLWIADCWNSRESLHVADRQIVLGGAAYNEGLVPLVRLERRFKMRDHTYVRENVQPFNLGPDVDGPLLVSEGLSRRKRRFFRVVKLEDDTVYYISLRAGGENRALTRAIHPPLVENKPIPRQ